jgi:hypothetical protein
VTDAMETTTGKTFGRKVRSLAVGALVSAVLFGPAVSAVAITVHEAGKAPVAKPASHRLALNVTPNSLRLT